MRYLNGPFTCIDSVCSEFQIGRSSFLCLTKALRMGLYLRTDEMKLLGVWAIWVHFDLPCRSRSSNRLESWDGMDNCEDDNCTMGWKFHRSVALLLFSSIGCKKLIQNIFLAEVQQKGMQQHKYNSKFRGAQRDLCKDQPASSKYIDHTRKPQEGFYHQSIQYCPLIWKLHSRQLNNSRQRPI